MKKTAKTVFVFMCLFMVFAIGCSREPFVYGTIHEAAGKGNLADVQRHLQRGAYVNASDKNGGTPLTLAALKGHLDVVRFLVDKGADVNARNKDGDTPLIQADANDHPDVVEFLEKHGAKE